MIVISQIPDLTQQNSQQSDGQLMEIVVMVTIGALQHGHGRLDGTLGQLLTQDDVAGRLLGRH
jgi:hypothetical protein